jgi:hypothetical protein
MTTETPKRKRGRPPKSETAMSPAERQRRYIEKLKAEAAIARRALMFLRQGLPKLVEASKESRKLLELQRMEWFKRSKSIEPPEAYCMAADIYSNGKTGENAVGFAVKILEDVLEAGDKPQRNSSRFPRDEFLLSFAS